MGPNVKMFHEATMGELSDENRFSSLLIHMFLYFIIVFLICCRTSSRKEKLVSLLAGRWLVP